MSSGGRARSGLLMVIWTGSEVVAGMDMVAHWIKENFGLDVLIQAGLSLDYEPRDIRGMLMDFSMCCLSDTIRLGIRFPPMPFPTRSEILLF